VCVGTPVQAELEGHHGSGDDPQAEADREDLLPELEDLQVERIPGAQVDRVDNGQQQ
jgi:hypothetical protein